MLEQEDSLWCHSVFLDVNLVFVKELNASLPIHLKLIKTWFIVKLNLI